MANFDALPSLLTPGMVELGPAADDRPVWVVVNLAGRMFLREFDMGDQIGRNVVERS